MIIVELFNAEGQNPTAPIECAVCDSMEEALNWIDAKSEEWDIHTPVNRIQFSAKPFVPFMGIVNYMIARTELDHCSQ